MNLKELQAMLDDKLMMSRIYDALVTSAKINKPDCRFMHTDDYPNRHNSVINKEQIAQLKEDGYDVVDVSEHGSYVYYVSGWKV